jgi:excisionase family DNA binding protein
LSWSLDGEESMRQGQKAGNTKAAEGTNALEPTAIPFAHRLSCTIAEACEATGLGRTKLYELIGDGHLTTTTVGRRRLVLVRSLLSLLQTSASGANGRNG